jgi:hypothetical protein
VAFAYLADWLPSHLCSHLIQAGYVKKRYDPHGI